jgi:GNAT superfamily N-acetyltransferase
MFADRATARNVERAEAAVTRAMVEGVVGSVRATKAFLRELDPGVAAYVRPGSPLNKLIAVGLDGPIEEVALGTIEKAFHREHEPVRAEIATLAAPETCEQLTTRGYRLLGFENVLALRIERNVPSRDGGVRVERVSSATLPAFREAVVEGAAVPDGTGVVADVLSRGVIENAIDDSLAAAGFVRYVAYLEGALAGGASMRVHEHVAVLTGAATLPAHRRRGVQAALLTRRLYDAHALGAELAIITTAPGTQSQANVMKRGFSLIYARALLALANGSGPR